MFRLFVSLLTIFFISNIAAQSIDLSIQTGHSDEIKRTIFSPDGNELISIGKDNKIVVWDIASGKQKQQLGAHTKEVNDIIFVKSLKQFVTGGKDGVVRFWSYPEYQLIKEVNIETTVYSLATNHEESKLLIGGGKLKEIDLTTYKIIQKKSGYNFYSALYGQDRSSIFYAQSHFIGQTNLSFENELSVKTKRAGFQDVKKVYARLHLAKEGNDIILLGEENLNLISSNAGKLKYKKLKKSSKDEMFLDIATLTNGYAATNSDGYIYLFDWDFNFIRILNDKPLKRLTNISSNGDLKLAVTHNKSNISLIDVASGNFIKSFKGTVARINDFKFCPSGSEAIIVYDDGGMRYWNFTEGNQMIYNQLTQETKGVKKDREYNVTSIKKIEENVVTLSAENYQYFDIASQWEAQENKRLFEIVWDLSTNEFTIENEHLAPKQDSPWKRKTRLYAVADDNSIENALNTKADSALIKKILATHTDQVTAIDYNAKHKIFASAGWDGIIRLWNKNTLSPFVKMLAIGKEDFLYITPENYYFAAKPSLKHVGFRMSNKVYDFEQFDLKYNRPDIVLRELPFAHNDLVAAFERAYRKRLEKLGIESLEEIFLNAPEISVKTFSEGLTDSSSISINVSGFDDKTKLKSLHVDVNGVPFYGKGGLSISANGLDSLIQVPLSNGKNSIACYLKNKNEIKSISERIEINCNYDFEKEDLFIVSIGSGKFKQSEYDLNYAAKDAEDVHAEFSTHENYNKTFSLLIKDEEVVKTSLDTIGKFLNKADYNDVVIIFIAGHGLLSKDFDYYLSTNDINFNNPETNGIPYLELEDLLDNVKSRKKILFMDACHSGEIDKSEAKFVQESNEIVQDVKFRAVGSAVNTSPMGLSSSFELSKELFADMRTSCGATVISSAGGGEYAMESSKWNNGVFTYALLNGLSSNGTDLNDDGNISVNELQTYIQKEVYQLTNGKQKPTNRLENIETDFIIKRFISE
jgi:WD40 repeat protein